MIRSLAPCLSLCVGLAGAAAAQCPSPQSGALSAPDAPRAFTQERQLSGVNRPIVSQGVATAEADGVLWRVTTPIEIVTRIANDGVTQSIEGGPFEPVARSSGGDLATQLGFAALVRADFDALAHSYEINVPETEAGAPWAMTLTPRDPQLAEQISAIKVVGCNDVERVAVEQVNGDKLLVDFSGPAG